MNITSRWRSKAASCLGKLLYTSLLVCGLGVTSAPPVQAASVGVDQSPLIIQRSLPPNVVLMLDDSGSMAWDYMPDWGYLSNTTNDGVRNASINGTYYNPSVTYTPPFKADGTLYPAARGLTNAYADGFAGTGATDITRFTGGNSSNARTFPYYTMFTFITTSTYGATGTTKYTCLKGYSGPDGKNNCTKTGDPNKGTVVPATGTTTYSCRSGDTLSGTQCTTTTTTYKYFFTYTTGASNTQNYVGVTGDCASLTSAQQAVCDDSSATQQNVANWFSYYHTRILMAKSGLMNSFVTLDPTFRVGFGSINGNNNSGLPLSTTTYNSKKIAQVSPFGDGSTNTQKNNFWKWLVGASASGGTPLHASLDAVGQYYKSDQPWQGMSSDPDYGTGAANAELTCRQSYSILTTDGFWNGTIPSGIGDVDGTAGSTVTGPNGQSYTYTPALPYADSGNTASTTDTRNASCGSGYTLTSGNPYVCKKTGSSNQTPTCPSGYTISSNKGQCTKVTPGVTYGSTLADVAMKYWSTDLRPNAANEVPANAEDLAFWQHMTTFTLGMGFAPEYANGSKIPMEQVFAWANGDASKAIDGFSWPEPGADQISTIADLAHAAVNGHGGFYSASSPESFANGLKDALKRAAERVGTGASLAANSTQLQTGTVAYQANYWTAKWKGDLKALEVDSSNGKIATNPTWTASSKLPAVASRNIKTYNPAAAGSQFVDFKVGTSGALPAISASQLTALGANAAAQASMINYLRGDDSQEQSRGGIYRNRDTAIGDIVNSQPVYAGAPNPNQFYTESFTGSTAFPQFASDNAARTGAIYVASNDGMLHGFNATTGAESFAYLPGAVITAGVSALASPEYGGDVAHAFFNDGELTVADAYLSNQWRTVLVGTTGRGVAKAVYALDITDPANVKFLWERSASDGRSNSTWIGQMTGKPVIAQTANGTWSVLMGNGYNSAAGKAALLQFNLTDGTLNVHKTTDDTGLAAPAVWMDPSGNGVSTVAYAGDVNGNVWSFAINTNEGSSTSATPTSDGVRLFTVKDASNKAQPITAGLLAGKNPSTGDVWVFFGTGRYLTTGDLLSRDVQSWYGLIVQSATAGRAVSSSMTRTDNLAARSITGEPATGGRTVTTLAQAAAAGAAITGKSGWYMDLKSPVKGAEGERMVTPSQFQGNLLLGTTRIPQATDPCNPSGRGWIMAIDPFTGTNPSTNFFDINGDGKIDASDSIGGTPSAGIGFTSLPNNPIFTGSTMLVSFDSGATSSIQTSGSSGGLIRVSWRELISQ